VRGAVLRNSIPPVDAADIAGEKHCSGVLSQLFSPSRSGLNTNRYRTFREIRDGGFRACSLWDCCVRVWLWPGGPGVPELVATASVCTPVRCLGCRNKPLADRVWL
jgi:hypothetical protein